MELSTSGLLAEIKECGSQIEQMQAPGADWSPGDSAEVKGTVCLNLRNAWDEFLFALGKHDESRGDPAFVYTDEKRVVFAAKEPEWSRAMLETIKAAIAKVKEHIAEGGDDDPYLASIQTKYDLLSSHV